VVFNQDVVFYFGKDLQEVQAFSTQALATVQPGATWALYNTLPCVPFEDVTKFKFGLISENTESSSCGQFKNLNHSFTRCLPRAFHSQVLR
jgi:hypothetical protein